MIVEWAPATYEDIRAIRNYIAENSPNYAEIFITRLVLATKPLEDFPELGRRVPENTSRENIRELIYHGYRIIYQFKPAENRVVIATVVHGSRDISEGDLEG